MEFLLSEEHIMVFGEGDVVEAAITVLQERLGDWDWYDVEKTDRIYPIKQFWGSLYTGEYQDFAGSVKHYAFYIETNLEEKTATVTVDRV